MNLLEQLGLDESSFTWHSLGLCVNSEDPEVFFDKYESDSKVAKQVDEMCLHCPVMKQCADSGMSMGAQGVWGGVYWNGAGRPEKFKNSHKTEDVWSRIKERLSE